MSDSRDVQTVQGDQVEPLPARQVVLLENTPVSARASAVVRDDERDNETSTQLGTDSRDLAACVREARRNLSARPQHDDSGRPLPGNTRTMTIGHRSQQMAEALEPVRRAIYTATLNDMGCSADGPDRPTETMRMMARNLATLDVLAETFWTWIEQQGVMTAKGKTRSAVTALLSIIDRQTKLATAIGLERRTKDLGTLTAAQYAALHGSSQEDQP